MRIEAEVAQTENNPRIMNGSHRTPPTALWTRLEEVSFIRRRRLILTGTNWTLRRAAIGPVLGANGSGKTTLPQLLAGYLWPSRGQITVLGEPFGRTDLRELRKKIGWVGSFLQSQIPSGQRPLDLIVSGKYASIGIFEKPDQTDYEKAEELAGRFGCSHLLESPYGVLSQGEKQRLLIARALIHQPQLLILDEPCPGLDLVAREKLLQGLEALSRTPNAPTMIFVTHHLEEIMPSWTHVLLLKQGKCLAQGRKQEILSSELLSEAFETPIQITTDGGRYRASACFG